MKVQAKHRIHRASKPGKAATKDTPAVRPELQIINPGQVFTLEGKELEQMLSLGAVVEYKAPKVEEIEEVEEAEAPKKRGRKSKAKAEEADTDESEEDEAGNGEELLK